MSTTGRTGPAPKVVIATTVALSFISFWRGAAIVLSDLASSVYYAGGIAEQAIGKSAPWFVLGVVLFSFAMRSVYLESCSMFVRGGVYVVVRDSMGPFMGRLSVSALVFDYILTGPISAVSAGLYTAGLLNEISALLGQSFRVTPSAFAVLFGLAITGFYWRSNVKGIGESSGKALRIMQITTIMVVILLLWAPLTILIEGRTDLPPAPTPSNLDFSEEAEGWLKGTFWLNIPLVAIIVAFGHSFLAMSGFETLAQVYREIASPKLKNLKITANIVCGYAVISTGLVTIMAVMIISDSVRAQYADNLIGGLAMNLAGPELMRLGFHVFVVIVGALLLSGAVNTSFIGANGVLNRVAEDGVLLDWFRKPHKRYGTSYRIIYLIALLQAGTIIASRGNVYLLGEAYAFGIVWGFFMKAVGVMALRFQRHDQEYKVPFNLHIGGREWPIGLFLITLIIFLVAVANLFSKRIATIYGVAFTVVLFTVFTVSERINRRKRQEQPGMEHFNLDLQTDVAPETIRARPGCVLVAVRDNRKLTHLKKVLEKTNLRRHDIVVMTVRRMSAGAGEYDLREDQLFADYERTLFSRVVALAEREGKHVELLVVPGVDPFDAMVQTAAKLKASRLVTGVSAQMDSNELARRIGLAWERLPEPRHPFSLEVISPGRPSIYVNLGPHPPRLWPEDVEKLHDLWLELSQHEELGARLHHRDVVGLALRRLEKDLSGEERQKIIEELKRELRT
ncbi:MAG TPA: APC family permease [Bryobacteraceae bacterium]|nr:APC family permease [Bryobacteraceae bacterium]HPU70965.1 APC family permease [Bryobacteraceae bacterium]